MKSHGARVLGPVRKDPAAMSNMEPESRIQGPTALRFNLISVLSVLSVLSIIEFPRCGWGHPRPGGLP